MQAVIFVAGRGTRMAPLTDATPKPMLDIAGKPLLEHKFNELPKSVDEVVLVVGYLGGVIHDYFGGSFGGRRVLYVEQDNPTAGTADALWCAKDFLGGKFLAMNGDDLYAKEDAEKCAEHDWAILIQERDPLLSGGKVALDAHHCVQEVREGSHHGKGFINAGMYALDTRVFDFPLVPKAEDSSEHGLPQTIMAAARALSVPVSGVPATFWVQITEPADLKKAAEFLMYR